MLIQKKVDYEFDIIVSATVWGGVSGSKIYIEYVDFKSWKIC